MLDTMRRSLSAFMAILFVISSVMTGTLCWQTQQMATNIVTDDSGSASSSKTVELFKLEKQEDGSTAEKTIAGTVFMLFKEDGEQVGARYVTDENGKISVQLKNGKYYFEEVAPSVGYTYDTENGKPIKQYPFTVSGNNNTPIVVKAYNIRLEGSLLVRKTVENTEGSELTDIQKNMLFEFTVTFSDNGTYTYYIDDNKGEKQTLESGGTLKLAHGQTAVFEDVPVGVLYNVTETPVNGYSTTGNGHRGNIVEGGAVAEFVNRISADSKFGSLTITKEVVGAGSDINKEFIFTAVIGGEIHEFTLKHGESKTFTGLPIGTQYTVTEVNSAENGYISTVKEYTGRITEADELTLPFVNVYDESPEGKTGSVSVTKIVSGENPDTEKVFSFEIVFEGENAPEKQSFTLKANETKVFENIPYGVNYVVRETDAAGYDKAVDAVSGTVAGEQMAAVTFKNTVPDDSGAKTKLTVTKRLAGEYLESEKEIAFEFVLLVNGQKTEFTLKAGETKEFSVPIGAVYEVREQDYFSDGYVQTITNGTGTVNDNRIAVVVTNEHHSSYEEKVVISGKKTWKMGTHTDVILPESIVVRLKNGELLIEEKTVTPDASGKWSYSFIAPKYNSDGSVAVYTIEEAPVDHYSPTYNGYNIVNTYVEKIIVNAPIIRKVVSGENAPETEFHFVVKGANGAPMPEGSEGNMKKLALTGAGELEIGAITFTKPGVYVYTVDEISDGAEGWTYDPAVYTITFTITEKKGKLHAESVIEKNNEVSSEIVFTNVYDESELSNNIVISGTKTWNHGTNPKNKRPTSIVVKVFGDGKLIIQRQVTAKNGWKYTFTLPKFAADGHEIVYTIDEATVKHYSKTINGYDLHNTYTGKPGGTPQTGDNSNLMIWSMLMITSGIVSTFIFVQQRKKKNNSKMK